MGINPTRHHRHAGTPRATDTRGPAGLAGSYARAKAKARALGIP